MKKVLYFTPLFLTSICCADQLHNYEQIKSAVSEGKLIRIYVDYTKCTSPSNQRFVPNHDAVYTPNAMAVTVEGKIVANILYFTLNDPRYPSKAVYQYGRYAISSDNSLTLTFTTLNATDYVQLDEASALNCKLDDAAKVFVSPQAG